jgi:hypothetical protein
MRLAVAAALAAASFACVDRRVIDVPLDAYAFEYGFVVLLDEEGAVTRVSQPFGVEDGALTFGALPAYDLEPEEREILLLGLPAGAVASAVADFDPARANEIELTDVIPGVLPFYVNDTSALVIELPQGTRALRGEFEGGLADVDLPGDFVLIVPIAPESCGRFAAGGLVPFGPSQTIIPLDPGMQSDDFFFIDLLDESTAIGMTPRAFYLVRSDGTFSVIGSDGLPGPDPYLFAGFAYDRGASTVWLAAVARANGLLMEISVSPFELGVVDTATLANARFADVALDPEGRPMIIAEDGGFFRFEGAGRFTELARVEGFVPDEYMHRLHATGDDQLPYLAASEGRLHVYDADRGSWVSDTIPGIWLNTYPADVAFKGNGLTSTRNAAGQLELWAAGTGGLLLRRVELEPWAAVDLHYPPRFIGCSSGLLPYPDLVGSQTFDGLIADGEDLFITLRECTAMIQVRPGTNCTAVLSIGVSDPAFYDIDLQAIAIFGDTLVLAGEDALMFTGKLR